MTIEFLEVIVMEQQQWEELTPEQKKRELYLEQKFTLDAFLERHAISQAQYDKSLSVLNAQMADFMQNGKINPVAGIFV